MMAANRAAESMAGTAIFQRFGVIRTSRYPVTWSADRTDGYRSRGRLFRRAPHIGAGSRPLQRIDRQPGLRPYTCSTPAFALGISPTYQRTNSIPAAPARLPGVESLAGSLRVQSGSTGAGSGIEWPGEPDGRCAAGTTRYGREPSPLPVMTGRARAHQPSKIRGYRYSRGADLP